MPARVLILTLLLSLLILGCGESGSTLPSLTLTPSPTLTGRAAGLLTVQFCTDDTGSYARENFTGANRLVASSLINATTPDAKGEVLASGGIRLYATLITSHTFDPNNTLAPFEVPATTPPPLPPLRPTPTPGDPDQFHAHTVRQSVDATNSQTISQYNAAMTAYRAQLDSLKAQVTSEVQRLITWDPPVDEQATSIWGCLALAQQRLTGQPGTKLLLIASDMENNTCIDCVPLHLDGVRVHIIFFQSDNAIRAQQKEVEWTTALVQAGVRSSDLTFDDPAATQAFFQARGSTLFDG